MTSQIRCPHCPSICHTDVFLSEHFKNLHPSNLTTTCYCPHDNCFASFSDVYAYKRHHIRAHKIINDHLTQCPIIDSVQNVLHPLDKPTLSTTSEKCSEISMNRAKRQRDELEPNPSNSQRHFHNTSLNISPRHINIMEPSSIFHTPVANVTRNEIQNISDIIEKNAAHLVAGLYSQPGIPRVFVNTVIKKFSQFYNENHFKILEKK